MTRTRVFKMVVFLLIWLGVVGCENEKEEYDKAPDWLKGSASELLSSKENYKLFLKAAEMTGYLDVLSGKGLCTVFAPDDVAITAWLSKQGKSSLSDVDPAELMLMVGYHILEQAYKKELLVYFSMTYGALGNGEAHKFKTFAKEDPIDMFDENSQQEVKVFQREKYIPIFSTQLYKKRECSDPEQVHKYLFPDVNWKGMDEQLYLGNASVTEYEIATDNGYVYTIDKVVDFVPTIYDALGEDNGGAYTTFRELFDRFKLVKYDQKITDKYAAAGDKLYLFYHNREPRVEVDLPELASGWAYHGEHDGLRPAFDKYMTNAYNCFSFTNEAYNDFFTTYFSEYATDDDLSQLTLYYLLKSHTDDHKNIKLIDNILEKGVGGEMGEKWILKPENIPSRRYCANGVLYGIDSVFHPLVYDIITRPLFQKPYFSVMANMFHISNEFVSLVSQEKNSYSLLLTRDDVFEEEGYRINHKGSIFGDEIIEYRKDPNSAFEEYKNFTPFVHSHIIYGAIEDLKTPKYYATKKAFNYVFVKNDTIFTETIPLEIKSEGDQTINGVTYEVDNMLKSETRDLIQIISKDIIYNDFFKILQKAELFELDGDVWEAEFLKGDRYMVFVPTKTDLDKIVETGEDLANYLKYFFVPITANLLSDYILPNFGAEQQEFLTTLMVDKSKSTPNHLIYKNIRVKFNDAESLKLVNDAENKEVEQTIITDGNRADFATNAMFFRLKDGTFSPVAN